MLIKSSTTFTVVKAFGHDGSDMWMQGPAKEYSVFGSLETSDTIDWFEDTKGFEESVLDMNSRIFPFRVSDLSDLLVSHKQIHYQKYALLRMFLSTPETLSNKWILLYGMKKPLPSFSSQIIPNRALYPVKAHFWISQSHRAGPFLRGVNEQEDKL